MKRIITFFACIVIANAFFAQQTQQVQWGKPEKYPMSKSSLDRKILGVKDNYLYAHGPGAVGFGGVKFYEIFRVNVNTLNIERLKLNMESDKIERVFKFCTMIKENICIFSSFQNKKHQKHYLFVQTVNKGNFTLNNDIQKIAELDYEGESKKSPCAFSMELSPDSSKILIHYVLKDDENYILRNGFTVYDPDFNMVRKVNEVTSGIDGLFLFQEFAVDNNANVYVTGKLYADEKRLKHFPENGILHLIAYSKNVELPTPVAIKFPENKYPLRVKIGISQNSDVYCAGYYSQEEMANAIGVFSVKYDVNSRTCGNVYTKSFDFNYLTKGMDDSDITKIKKAMENGNDFEVYDYVLSDLKFRENGTFTLISEKYFYKLIVIQNGRSFRSIPYYYYGDIMIANFNTSDGSFNWMQKVPREALTKLSQTGSYSVLYGKNNSTHILYNTMRLGSLTKESKHKEAELVIVTLSDNGKESFKKINKTTESDFFARAAEIFYTGNEIIVIGQSGSKKVSAGKYSIDF